MQRFEELSSALRLRARRSARAADNKPAKVPIGESSTKTFRILCFHGFVQNGDILKQKTGSLRRAMKGCEFIFLDAPHSAAGAFQEETAAEKNEAAASEGVGPRGWWVSEENARKQQGEAWVRPAQSYACVGFEEGMACAREAAVRVCEDGQQIHGVLAFSQGCAVATCLLREAQLDEGHPLSSVNLAILVGGFVPRDPETAAYLQGDVLRVHSLHVSGANDLLVPKLRSEALAALFDSSTSTWFEHPGGHGIPTGTGLFKQDLQALLQRALRDSQS
mmetsp:Transcript_20969/g.49106  ORF Transcript_20969/g.49106 Transcript_20969/m.49106 type:complete len:277 (+) Transcript_20969:61-891(+)